MTTPTTPAAPAAPSSGTTPANTGGAPGGQPPAGGTGNSGAPAGGKGGAGAPPPVPTRHKWTDKVNGRDVEFEASDEDLRASYRHRRAADERFEAAAKTKREVEELRQTLQSQIGSLKQNPKEVLALLRQAGFEQPMDVLADLLQSELSSLEENQDPNVRARRKAEQELSDLKTKQEREERARKSQEFEAKVDAETTRIEGLFSEALGKLDLPKDADTLRIMASLESTNRRMGLKLTPDQLAAKTEDYVRARAVKLLLKMDPEKLFDLNPELSAMFRKTAVKRYRAKQGKGGTPAEKEINKPPPPKPGDPTGPKMVTDKEEFDQMMGGRRGLRSL